MKDSVQERDELLQMVPELPEGFTEWCENKMQKAPVFYKRTGNYTECQCGICGEKYRLKTPEQPMYGTLECERPVRHEQTECVKCKQKTYYEWKRVTRVTNEDRYFYLYQLLKDGSVVVRIFECFSRWEQGMKQKIETQEVERIFLIKGQVKKMAHYYTWYSSSAFWSMEAGKGFPKLEVWKAENEAYPGWEDVLKESNLKYCRVKEICKLIERRRNLVLHTIEILMAYTNNPALEMYEKAGLSKLVQQLVWREGIIGAINRRKDTLEGQLRLKDKTKIKKFMKEKGQLQLLEVLQYEEKHNYNWTDEQENWVLYYWGALTDSHKAIDILLKYMSIQQLMNRVEKYRKSRQDYHSIREVIAEYRDYLKMREELGYDMTNEVFIHPKNLNEKHAEMVKESASRKNELTIKTKNKEFPNIRKNYEKLCKKYQARTDGYIIRPARDAGEIIMEGRILHHCVGRDQYLRSHNTGKSHILFLRKEKKPDVPYITIEIAGTEIKQWYGAHDTKPDKEIIEQLLKDYVQQLAKKKKKLNAAG